MKVAVELSQAFPISDLEMTIVDDDSNQPLHESLCGCIAIISLSIGRQSPRYSLLEAHIADEECRQGEFLSVTPEKQV